MSEFDTDPIRRAVLASERPFHSACSVIGCMVGTIEVLHGTPVAAAFLRRLLEEMEQQEPDHTITDL
jgi:hypothetical protein